MASLRMTILEMIVIADRYGLGDFWQWNYKRENEERDNKLVVIPLAFLAMVILFIILVVIPMMTVDFDYGKINSAAEMSAKILVVLFVLFLLAFGSIAIRESICRWRDE